MKIEQKYKRPAVLLRLKERLRPFKPEDITHFPVLEEPVTNERIIFFAPHPDDEALAAGGYLHRAVKKGAKCLIVLVTDGNRRGLKQVRAREFAAVLQALNINVSAAIRLDYINGKLSKVSKSKLLSEFTEIIVSFKATRVITPHPADLHREHQIIAQLVKNIYDRLGSFHLLQYLIHYPPIYPWPRARRLSTPLLPPPDLVESVSDWVIFPLSAEEVMYKHSVVELYPSQLKTPILRGLMYALVRTNELFRCYPKKD